MTSEVLMMTAPSSTTTGASRRSGVVAPSKPSPKNSASTGSARTNRTTAQGTSRISAALRA
jgi:hypothetical protein